MGYIGFILLMSNLIQAQEFNLINSESSVKVYGTSSLHDWHIDAENKNGKVVLKNLETGEVDKCDFTVVVESLKSGKNSMDKNTYKALKSDEYKNITFKLQEVKEIVKKGENKFLLKSVGYLTVSGVKKLIPIEFNLEVLEGKIVLSGEKEFKMTEFNVEPPKALFGTITTGDSITVKFNSIFKQ
ncbi:YceI family protein [Algibacter sp.]|uniref:YceI family protein n=1 Tax=Algibacter sp. TaxID=1872428 RepID=UPI003C712887